MPLIDENSEVESHAMSLGEHIDELRKRLILSLMGGAVGIGFCFFYASRIIAYLRAPYERVMSNMHLEPRLQTLTPTDGFTSYMLIATWSGIVLTSPWSFYQLWKFVSAGLYPKERRYVYIAAPASAALFIIGALFSALLISPLTLQFFVTFNRDVLGIDSAFTFQSYMSFMVNMMLVFGLSFQTPILLFFLNKFGILPLSLLTKSRRYVILIVTIVAAVLTPGTDAVSLLTLAVPLYFLFEMGILLIWLFGRKPTIEQNSQSA
jgi:sec-independent protein translocase protein TatC